MNKQTADIVAKLMNAAHPDEWEPNDIHWDGEYYVVRNGWTGDPDDNEPEFYTAEDAGVWLAENVEKDWAEHENP